MHRQVRPYLLADQPGVRGPQDLLRAALERLDLPVCAFDGLITDGKFCCVRRAELSLTWWRRPVRLRASVLQSDVSCWNTSSPPAAWSNPSRRGTAGGRPIGTHSRRRDQQATRTPPGALQAQVKLVLTSDQTLAGAALKTSSST